MDEHQWGCLMIMLCWKIMHWMFDGLWLWWSCDRNRVLKVLSSSPVINGLELMNLDRLVAIWIPHPLSHFFFKRHNKCGFAIRHAAQASRLFQNTWKSCCNDLVHVHVFCPLPVIRIRHCVGFHQLQLTEFYGQGFPVPSLLNMPLRRLIQRYPKDILRIPAIDCK